MLNIFSRLITSFVQHFIFYFASLSLQLLYVFSPQQDATMIMFNLGVMGSV